MSDALLGAVRSAWQEAAAGTVGLRAWRAVRTPVPGPLTVLAAIRETDGALSVLFEAAIESAPSARARFEADGISMLEERNYPDRIYRIAVALERRDLANIFEIVIADLIEAAAAQSAPAGAISALVARLAAWQGFLRARHTGLGREAVVGLIGELLMLQRAAIPAGYAAAVDAWQGPTGGLHDFVRKGVAVEVKASSGVASAIVISTLDQLEDAGLASLILAHVHLAETPGGLSLPALVGTTTKAIERQAPEALRRFKDALLASGYADVDADLYQARTYQPLTTRFYLVSAGFPRLTRSNAPQGIAEAQYRLDLRSIQPHGINEDAANDLLRQMGDT